MTPPDTRTCLEKIEQCFRHQHPGVAVPDLPGWCYSRESAPLPTASFAEEPMGNPEARALAWEE